jgi:anti-sigma B factor antagonist
MRQLARIVAETRDDVAVARIEGEVDTSNADVLTNRLRGLLTNRSVALVIDLSPTTYLDSSGIRLLFGLADELRRRQQQLHIVIPETSLLRRVVTITGLDKALPTHTTVEHALEQAAKA